MHPDQIKKIEMVADAVEDGERRLSLIEENDEASGEDKAKSKTPDKYKMTALWCILPDSLRDEAGLKSDEHGGEHLPQVAKLHHEIRGSQAQTTQ